MGITRTQAPAVNGQAKIKSQLQEIGASGLHESYGRIDEDFLQEWDDVDKRVKNIDRMLLNSPIIGAVRLSYEMSMRGASWTFTNGDESINAANPNTEGITDPRLILIADSLAAMSHSWDDHLAEAMMAVWYGWSMFTTQYQRATDGRIMWRKFKQLGNDTVWRWAYDKPNAPGMSSLIGMWQKPHLYPEMIPIERMLIYRLRKNKNNPEGESLLRSAWIPFYYSVGLTEVEAIGLERNIAGMPVIELPMGADATDGSTDLTQAAKIVRNVRNDEQAGLVLPPPRGPEENDRWRFSLLSASGGSQSADLDRTISRHEKRILMSVLTQSLMLGMDNVGALATFEGGKNFLTVAVNAIADMVAETFTKFECPKILELNGMDKEAIKLEHTTVGDVDLMLMADFLQKSGALITWSAEDEVWLRSLARMPERAIEDIMQEREEKEAKQAEALANLRKAQAAQNQGDEAPLNIRGDEEDTAVDENSATITMFATAAPDQRERDAFERKWIRQASAFFNGQLQRVEKGAKKIK